MSIEAIADLCGHTGTTVTEKVYRHQLRPVLLNGAVAMDRIFAPGGAGQGSDQRRYSGTVGTQERAEGLSDNRTDPLNWWAILGLNQ